VIERDSFENVPVYKDVVEIAVIESDALKNMFLLHHLICITLRSVTDKETNKPSEVSLVSLLI
jgi:hypothetical protein